MPHIHCCCQQLISAFTSKTMSQESASSDYFDNDPGFLEALAAVPLPEGDPNIVSHFGTQDVSDDANLQSPTSSVGDNAPPSTQPGLKRRRADGSDEEMEMHGTTQHAVIASVDQDTSKSTYLTSNTYGASHFGNFGEYMNRKRQKLQIQNTEMDGDKHQSSSSRIFRGLQIYVSNSSFIAFMRPQSCKPTRQINGWTEPSVQELRQMIIQHGGIYHAYLDKKSLVSV